MSTAEGHSVFTLSQKLLGLAQSAPHDASVRDVLRALRSLALDLATSEEPSDAPAAV